MGSSVQRLQTKESHAEFPVLIYILKGPGCLHGCENTIE